MYNVHSSRAVFLLPGYLDKIKVATSNLVKVEKIRKTRSRASDSSVGNSKTLEQCIARVSLPGQSSKRPPSDSRSLGQLLPTLSFMSYQLNLAVVDSRGFWPLFQACVTSNSDTRLQRSIAHALCISVRCEGQRFSHLMFVLTLVILSEKSMADISQLLSQMSQFFAQPQQPPIHHHQPQQPPQYHQRAPRYPPPLHNQGAVFGVPHGQQYSSRHIALPASVQPPTNSSSKQVRWKGDAQQQKRSRSSNQQQPQSSAKLQRRSLSSAVRLTSTTVTVLDGRNDAENALLTS